MNYLKKIINRFKKSTISIDELYYLDEILKTDLPLKTSLLLICNKANEALIDSLIIELDKGFLIEEIVNDYLPKEINAYFIYLIKKLSFKDSLHLSLAFYKKSKDNTKALEKAVSYPLILLFLSLTALYLFDSYGLDSVIGLMKSFDVNINLISIMRSFIRIVVYFFYILFIVVSLLILIFINPKRIRLLYIFISKHLSTSVIKTFFTEDFISMLIITLDYGYKTKEALEILKSIKNKPLVCFLASHLDDKLMNGESIKDASNQLYFDAVLTQFVNIASYSKNFTGILNNYVILAKARINNYMKRLTIFLQLGSYLVIGLVIVFIYQVLFLPMQALSNY